MPSVDIKVTMIFKGPETGPFDASRLKLSQARRYLARLEVLQGAHFCTDWRQDEFTPARGDEIAQLKTVMKLPGPEFSATIGDIIHNFRAALDLMAVSLVDLNGKNSKGVYFPFSKSAAELDEMIHKKKFHRAGKEAVALLKSLQPYPDGNPDLRAIHDLDIQDKHHTLIPAAGEGTTPEVRVDMIDGQPIISRVEDTTAKMKLCFPKDSPLAGQEILPTLHSLAQLVIGIVDAFAALPRR